MKAFAMGFICSTMVFASNFAQAKSCGNMAAAYNDLVAAQKVLRTGSASYSNAQNGINYILTGMHWFGCGNDGSTDVYGSYDADILLTRAQSRLQSAAHVYHGNRAWALQQVNDAITNLSSSHPYLYGSDGTILTPSGNFYFGSNGVSYSESGNNYFGSNGTVLYLNGAGNYLGSNGTLYYHQ